MRQSVSPGLSRRGKTFWKGEGAILLCALFWSTSGLFIKLLDWHPVVIAGTRSFVAFLFMLAVRSVFPPKTGGKNTFPFWAGAASYTLTMLTFVTANKMTAPANAIMLQYSAPVWAGLLGWILLKEKPRREHWGALVLVMAGMALFFGDGLKGGSFAGDALAVFSGISFGAHSVFLRMMKDGSARDSLLMAHALCAVFCIPLVFLYPPALSVSTVLPMLFMGVVQIGMASILFSYGIKRINALEAMLTAMLEPVCNPVWVFAVTGEKPSLRAVLGGIIIIAAVAASSIIGKRRTALQYEHRVAVAEKTIAFPDGFGVTFKDKIQPGKGRDKHE
ncbi:MAG: DMT family transporter [Treponema sp.]|jgi:drug/metabolite transporter (DMT)-like permease|nr:DMT family transporter [Treponema sp.]